jgi:anti-sigma factor RsiW
MQHLNIQEIRDLADGTLDGARQAKLLAHAEACRHCSRELAFERSLREEIRSAPVHRTSRNFTAKVMRKVDPDAPGLLFGLFGGIGKLAAMAFVLAIIAYALTLKVPGASANEPGPASALFQRMTSVYESVRGLLSVGSIEVHQTVDQRASGQGAQLFAMTFIVLLCLVLIDRYVLRHLVGGGRHKVPMKT